MKDGIAEAIEEFEPGLGERLMEGYTDVEISLGGNCRKCGAEVRLNDTHIEWHRNFTLALNFQSYKAAMTLGLLDTILSNVAERGITLEELVEAAVKARES